MSPMPVTTEKQTLFTRLPGELPIYRLPRGSHVLYYAPGYLVAVAAGQAEVFFSGLAVNTEDEKIASTIPYKPEITVTRALLNAAKTAVRSRTSATESSFQPLSLTLYLNHSCNLRCSYCYSEPRPSSRVRLSIDKINQAAQLVASNCAEAGKPLTLVCHGGGEPALDQEHLARVLTTVEGVAGSCGVPLFRYVATNGVLPAQVVSWLARRFDLIGLSCDGPPWIQNLQRPTWGGGPTSTAVERTAHVLRCEEAAFQVRMTVTPAMVDHLPEAVDYLCRCIKPGQIWVEPLYHGGRAQEGFSADDAPWFAEQFLAARENATVYAIPMLTSGNRLNQLHGPYCSLLQGSLQLLPDGAATACFKVILSGDNEKQQTVYSCPEAAEFSLDVPHIRQLQKTLGKTPAGCRECINEYHCTFGCPDHCLLDGQPPANSFRCRLGRQLTQRQLRTQGDALWIQASLNGGIAGTKITAWDEDGG